MTLSVDKMRHLLERPAVLSMIRIAGAGAGFLTQLILAWVLKPQELGVFYSATSLAVVAAIVSTQGYQQIAARFTARYQQHHKKNMFGTFVGRSMSDSLRLASLVAAAIAVGAFFYPGLDFGDRWAFAIGGAMVLPLTALTITTNLAGAMKHFGLCYIPEGLFRPIIFLGLILVLVVCRVDITIYEASAVFAGVTLAIAIAVWLMLRPLLPRWKIQPWRAGRLERQWRREAWPLILLSLFTNYFVDIAIIIATPFLPSQEIAVFGLCLKLALLVGYVVQVGQQMVVPDLAVARRNANVAEVASILRRSMFVPIVATAGALAAIAVFGKMLLSIFGPSFAVGQTALLILVFSQLIRALAGPSAHLLTLTGAQRLNAALCTAAIAVLLLSNLILVPPLGLAGAALAVVFSFTFWVASVAYALHGMGEFRTDVFALFKPQRLGKIAPAAGIK